MATPHSFYPLNSTHHVMIWSYGFRQSCISHLQSARERSDNTLDAIVPFLSFFVSLPVKKSDADSYQSNCQKTKRCMNQPSLNNKMYTTQRRINKSPTYSSKISYTILLFQKLQIDLPRNTWAKFWILKHPSCSASTDQWHFSTIIMNTRGNSEIKMELSFKRIQNIIKLQNLNSQQANEPLKSIKSVLLT